MLRRLIHHAVARDVPAGMLAVGAPARVIRELPKSYSRLNERRR
jgi:acetyltransferase-like isoleucine patch superfamily enzyme